MKTYEIIEENGKYNIYYYTDGVLDSKEFHSLDGVSGTIREEYIYKCSLASFRAILKLSGLEATIETALNELEEPTKTVALTYWDYGTWIERKSQTVLLLQSILQMNDEQVDNLFIQANAIQI